VERRHVFKLEAGRAVGLLKYPGLYHFVSLFKRQTTRSAPRELWEVQVVNLIGRAFWATAWVFVPRRRMQPTSNAVQASRPDRIYSQTS
jgi:hypothetical protein